MSLLQWIQSDWFTLLQSIGIIGGLFYTATAFRYDTITRRTENLIRITEHHHEIWSQLRESPKLARVLSPNPDLRMKPISTDEEFMVLALILHLSSVFHAEKSNLLTVPGNLSEDIAVFFSNPIPRKVWEKHRGRQDSVFVAYVEKSMSLPRSAVIKHETTQGIE